VYNPKSPPAGQVITNLEEDDPHGKSEAIELDVQCTERDPKRRRVEVAHTN
jgi:hypothetical protein